MDTFFVVSELVFRNVKGLKFVGIIFWQAG